MEQSKRCMWLSSLYSTANSCWGVVMASHLNLSVCKDIKLGGCIVYFLSALLRYWMRYASCYKKQIHLISRGSNYDFLCWLQQANHLNSGITKWEALSIKYGGVVQWIHEKHGLGKANECKAWIQSGRHVYETVIQIYMVLELLDYVKASPLSVAGWSLTCNLGRLLQARCLNNIIRWRGAANFQHGSCKAWSQNNR